MNSEVVYAAKNHKLGSTCQYYHNAQGTLFTTGAMLSNLMVYINQCTRSCDSGPHLRLDFENLLCPNHES